MADIMADSTCAAVMDSLTSSSRMRVPIVVKVVIQKPPLVVIPALAFGNEAHHCEFSREQRRLFVGPAYPSAADDLPDFVAMALRELGLGYALDLEHQAAGCDPFAFFALS